MRRTCAGRLTLARESYAAAHDEERADEQARPGRSSNTTTASMTANSGAITDATEALDAPASRIPNVMKSFEIPGRCAGDEERPAGRRASRHPWIAAADAEDADVTTA